MLRMKLLDARRARDRSQRCAHLLSSEMVFFQKLRKLFRRDSTIPMHPERRDAVPRVEESPRERNFCSNSFQLKVSEDMCIAK